MKRMIAEFAAGFAGTQLSVQDGAPDRGSARRCARPASDR